MNKEKIGNTYPDALTNLFVGIFAGSMLFSIQKIHFFEINPFDFNNFVLLMIELVYLVYLVFGYFTLFRVYHRDSYFYMNSYDREGKKIIKQKFTALAVVICLLTLLPHSFSNDCLIYFYPILLIALVSDIFWTNAYIKLHDKDTHIEKVSMNYVFDVMGISLCLVIFVLLFEWKLDGVRIYKIFNKKVFVSIVIFLHFLYFAPFVALYFRRESE
jgi:hypothetical protein